MAHTIKDAIKNATALDNTGVTRLRRDLEEIAREHPTLKVQSVILHGSELDSVRGERPTSFVIHLSQRPGRRR
jgi:hypothetical protein